MEYTYTHNFLLLDLNNNSATFYDKNCQTIEIVAPLIVHGTYPSRFIKLKKDLGITDEHTGYGDICEFLKSKEVCKKLKEFSKTFKFKIPNETNI